MKSNQKGFTHHLALIVVGVLVLSAVGFSGFRVYKSRNDVSAKAATYRWSDVLGNITPCTKGSQICVCKEYPAGGKVRINAMFNNQGYTTATWSVSSIKLSKVLASGSVKPRSHSNIHVSSTLIDYSDTLSSSYKTDSGTGGYRPSPLSNLANCF